MNERLLALARFGYTFREASFVELAALQSGYFVRRQFNDFIGRECGAIAQAFIGRGVRLGHLTGTTHLGGHIVYQFTTSALYSALGDPNNRNRRLHRNDTIRRRLMALDYCLAQSAEYLLTQEEKIQFFMLNGVAKEDLPADVFSGKAKSFFIDRQPISRRHQLAFIDEGFSGHFTWRKFLSKHRKLIQALPCCTLIYASPEERRFPIAERHYREVITGQDGSGSIDAGRLRRYFEARHKFETREFSSFNQARLDQLREDRWVFSGVEIEERFAQWTIMGEEALADLKSHKSHLSFHLLSHRYDWLSPIRKEIYDAAHSVSREKGPRGRYGQAG